MVHAWPYAEATNQLLESSGEAPRRPGAPRRLPGGPPGAPRRFPRGSEEDLRRPPRGFQEAGSQEDLRRLPGGSEEAPRMLPESSKEDLRRLAEMRKNGKTINRKIRASRRFAEIVVFSASV